MGGVASYKKGDTEGGSSQTFYRITHGCFHKYRFSNPFLDTPN